MKLITDQQRAALLRNGEANRQRREEDNDEIDFRPVVKLFTPDGGCTWLLTELDPDDPDIAFGLCDLGLGFPELGAISMSELAALRGRLGLPVERDRYFEADRPLSVYTDEAGRCGTVRV